MSYYTMGPGCFSCGCCGGAPNFASPPAQQAAAAPQTVAPAQLQAAAAPQAGAMNGVASIYPQCVQIPSWPPACSEKVLNDVRPLSPPPPQANAVQEASPPPSQPDSRAYFQQLGAALQQIATFAMAPTAQQAAAAIQQAVAQQQLALWRQFAAFQQTPGLYNAVLPMLAATPSGDAQAQPQAQIQAVQAEAPPHAEAQDAQKEDQVSNEP